MYDQSRQTHASAPFEPEETLERAAAPEPPGPEPPGPEPPGPPVVVGPVQRKLPATIYNII